MKYGYGYAYTPIEQTLLFDELEWATNSPRGLLFIGVPFVTMLKHSIIKTDSSTSRTARE